MTNFSFNNKQYQTKSGFVGGALDSERFAIFSLDLRDIPKKSKPSCGGRLR